MSEPKLKLTLSVREDLLTPNIKEWVKEMQEYIDESVVKPMYPALAMMIGSDILESEE